MTSHQAQQYLQSFINHENQLDRAKSFTFKLERVENLLKRLGNPQNDLKIIHVAGSKGKGSICALTANIVKDSGYSVGLYTSPHVNDMRERIRILKNTQHTINGNDIYPDMISEEELINVLEEIQPSIQQMRENQEFGDLTFFEVYTALALYYFKKQQVDLVILETGLGGRLDATNVPDSLIAVIAPISLEHTHILGRTIKEISKEKAAIIKDRDQKVIIASQENSAKEILKDRCSQFNIAPTWVDERSTCSLISQNREGQVFDLSMASEQYKKLFLPLLGAHQRDNCAVALSIVESLKELGYSISRNCVYNGIKNTFWPLRFEIINEEPLIVLDGAHNKASVKVLADTMNKIFNGRHVVLIFGISKDKDADAVLDELGKITDHVIFTKADHPRAGYLPGALDVVRALDLARRESDVNDVILVTGSMFVASEARQYLMEKTLCIN